jgi:hypothetical protein
MASRRVSSKGGRSAILQPRAKIALRHEPCVSPLGNTPQSVSSVEKQAFYLIWHIVWWRSSDAEWMPQSTRVLVASTQMMLEGTSYVCACYGGGS